MRRALIFIAAVPLLVAAATTTTAPRASVVGAPETVFDWTVNRCDREDIPDIHARAFRDAQGRVQLLAAHLVTRRMIGPDLDHLTRQCAPVLDSRHDPRPAHYDDDQWIAAPYTEDGQTIYALLHEEYHGDEHGKCVIRPCWMHSITSAFSYDGGDSYAHATPPGHLVASMPVRYRDVEAGWGYTNPSNIVHSSDGWYYAFVNQAHKAAPGGACLLRTQRLDDPHSWRAWNGRQFSFRFVNPYRERVRALRWCTPVIGSADSVTWNTYFGKWLVVGTDTIGNPPRGAFTFAVSDDLVHWTEHTTIVEFPQSEQCGEPAGRAYPSLIDPESPARNFDVSGRRAWLYYTEFNWNCGESYDRDLVRVAIEFSK